MLTTVIALIILIIAFFIITAIIFQPSCQMKSQAVIFIPLKAADLNSIESDVRTIMNDVNKNFVRTVSKVYLVNVDNDNRVAEICRRLCFEYPVAGVCNDKDLSEILTKQ